MLYSLLERLIELLNLNSKYCLSASCKLSVRKATVIYQGERVKVQEKFKNGMLHGEQISFFCKNKEKKCSYTVDAQCIDGTIEIPTCFKGESNTGTFRWDFHLAFTIISTFIA